MNGLVGYGSSSEEEDDASPHASAPVTNGTTRSSEPSIAIDAAQHIATTEGDNNVLNSVAEGPMVGPSMPSPSANVDQYEEDSVEQLPPMSERDLLRYLTQPSHPIASLPPEPTSGADPAVTAKFKRFLELKSKGVHFNEDLAGKSSFKNPSLFASLLERANLPSEGQYATVLPTDVFSIDKLPSWAYKEELLKSQHALSAELDLTREAQSAAGKRTIEFTPASQHGSGNQESPPVLPTKRKRP